jgi:diguanylate cyclase (GGDEF)-like protein
MAMLNSIRSKILVFAILATLIPSLGLGLLSFRQNEALIGDNVGRELRALASYASRELELWINERVHDVRALSTSNSVIDGLSAVVRPRAGRTGTNPQALAHYLRSVQEKLDPLLELTVVDAGGHVVASSAAAPATVTLPQSWPQSVLTEGVVIVPPHWDTGRATAALSVAVPVLSFDNELLGALVAVLDLRTAQPHLKSATKSPPGEVLLLDEGGRTLLSSHPEASALPPLNAALLQRLRAQPGEPMLYRGPTQREVIGLADVSAALPVTVVAERDRAEVYRGWVKLRNLFLMLVSGLALAVALVAYRLGRSIALPLQRLIGAADRIADGDLDVRLTIKQNDELGHLTQVFNQMVDKLRSSHAEVVAASQTLQQQNQLLETLSITDSLTGLYNRSKLDAILNDQIARYKRNQRPFAVLMLDIDHFKTLNDSRGHIAGDEVLAAVARILAQSIRSVDYAARYGGDEFVIILIDTPADSALETAERIRSHVASARYSAGDQSVTVTVSVGIAQWQPDDMVPTAVFARADQALYEAKRAGRNRVHCAA